MLVSFPAMKGNNKALKREKGEKGSTTRACSIYGIGVGGLRVFHFLSAVLSLHSFLGKAAVWCRTHHDSVNTSFLLVLAHFTSVSLALSCTLAIEPSSLIPLVTKTKPKHNRFFFLFKWKRQMCLRSIWTQTVLSATGTPPQKQHGKLSSAWLKYIVLLLLMWVCEFCF